MTTFVTRAPATLGQRVRAWMHRDVRYWAWRIIRARLALLRHDLTAPPTLAALRLADRLGLPIPDRAFRIAAQLIGIPWPDDPVRAAIGVLYYGEPLP